jgi:hypothetical protein
MHKNGVIMGYFRLFPDVILIEGDCKDALYSLTEGRVIQLGVTESRVLSQLRNTSIENTRSNFGQKAVDRLLQSLVKEALGTIYSEDVYSESYIPNMPFELRGYLESILIIEELSIELYPKDLYKIWTTNPKVIFQGCNSCIPAEDPVNERFLDIERLCSEIQNTEELEIKRAVLHIGDLQDHWDDIILVIERLRKAHPEIGMEIVTYLEEINDKSISFLKKIPNLRTTVCFEAETVENPSFFIQICNSLSNAGIPTTLDAIFSHQDNVNRYDSVKEFASHVGYSLRTTEIIHNSDDRVYSIDRGKSRIEKTDSDAFYTRQRYSICQYGKMAITACGKIGCCPFGIKTGSLERGIYDWLSNNEHKEGWESPKRCAGVCGHCENRFACIDCALIEQLSKKEPEFHKTICAYNPFSGIWEM